MAEFIVIPCSASLVAGKDARVHLNRLVTANVLTDAEMTRRESLICDLNGRIIGHLLQADLGEQIILIHSSECSEQIRRTLHSGIPWNEEVAVSSGDGAIHRLILVGKNPNRVVLGLGLNTGDLSSKTWTEFGDSMVSEILAENEIAAYEYLIPSRSLDSIIEALEVNGATPSSQESWLAIQSSLNQIDIANNSVGHLPFELGMEELVDLRKGCYPGQEIHARMESKGILARRLIPFTTTEELQTGKYRLSNNERLEILSGSKVDGLTYHLGLVSTKAEMQSEFTVKSESGDVSANLA